MVTDTYERALRLVEARSRTGRPFRILLTGPAGRRPPHAASDSEFLDESAARISLDGLDELLARRSVAPMSQVATVMFTSGSTGVPKGIAFTQYHLVAKRFARAAALPAVGNDEVLLCYLPLYHTFGRYLEMLGMLYWGGTYVFAGNISFETLLCRIGEVRPTGMISIPLRLAQIRDHCLEIMGGTHRLGGQEAVFRSVVGDRLRWGLSAAGHLDARVFRFFQRLGVDLCSGFGMTEGTGGLTMTPPGEYVDDTVGVPLPGVQVRFGDLGELEVAGPYIARYLAENSRDLPPQHPEEEYWLSTGDLFRECKNGYLQIVDRIKDIFKNNRGQTIAPRRVEQRFDGVPGIKRAVLVGDGRDANVLLVVPDENDPLAHMPEPERRAYFSRIVSAANAGLAPYERIVNFTVLDRDFSIDQGELTAKGSYRRKQIEEDFSAAVEQLYHSNYVDLAAGNLRIKIPRWMYRNWGLLENKILYADGALHVAGNRRSLPLMPSPNGGAILVGSLEYQIAGSIVDLGWFARQPKLWIGNPALVDFCACRDGWDLPTPGVSLQVRLPQTRPTSVPAATADGNDVDPRLLQIHRLCVEALFGPESDALHAVEKLGGELRTAGDRLALVIRTRLEALAWHPVDEVRFLAYRVLLADEPMPDYSDAFPAFVASGLPFLNENSMREIAAMGLGDSRLRALRRRLFHYRTRLPWPAGPVTRDQFIKIFDLLVSFARRHPEFFGPIRAELANWAIHRSDPKLAHAAERRLQDLIGHFESLLARTTSGSDIESKICFDDDIPDHAARSLRKVFEDASFLRQSVILACGANDFDIRRVPDSGIWVSRMILPHPFDFFRAAINLDNGKHYDLSLVLGPNFHHPEIRDTLYWLMAMSDHPLQVSALPRLGACRPDLQAVALAFVGELTVWDKIREYGALTVRTYAPKPLDWRRLFVRGMGAFFTAWRGSGFTILPGAVKPSNVVVPAADFREGACLLSLMGWIPYTDPLGLILPFVRNFYRQTAANYPHLAGRLSVDWIFDACMESLGWEDGPVFLAQLHQVLTERHVAEADVLTPALAEYRRVLSEGRYQPLALICARDRFQEWAHVNVKATQRAREEQVEQLFRLYRLDRFPEIVRCLLFRHTYFRRMGATVLAAFDRLLEQMIRHPETRAIHLSELSDLQAVLQDPTDRQVFSRMVFHRTEAPQGLEVLAIGPGENQQVILRTAITDRHGTSYSVHEPVVPAEIGQLYRLVRESDYPDTVSEQERHFVITDDSGQVVGGVRYQVQDENVAYLSSIVVAAMLKGRGLAGSLLEDFCTRMAAAGIRLVKTDFLLRRFFTAHGFRIDPRWGGLVRPL